MKNTIRRKVLVTGAGRGLGKAVAEWMAAHGDQVIGTVRDASRAEALTREAEARGLSLRFLPLELSDPGSIGKLAAALLEEGGLDVLVNNAGLIVAGPLEEVEPEALQRQFAVNLFGPHELTRRLLPSLRERRGCVVWMGSMAGDFPQPFQAPYAATKAAIGALSDAMRTEVKPFGVRVCCVQPNDFPTDQVRDRRSRPDSPYRERFERALQISEEQEKAGPSPELVARTIDRLSRLKDPPPRVAVGNWVNTIYFLKRLIPERARVAAVASIYKA